MDTLDNWDQHWKDLVEATQLNPAQQYRRELVLHALVKENLLLHLGYWI